MPSSGVKTLIIVVLLVLTGPWLTGCSALRLGYNNGPQLAWWWLDGYVDFSTEQTPAAKAAIGFMPQSTGAWSGISARGLLRYLAALYEGGHRPDDLIDALGLGAFAATPYRRLSGGQQQLVNLAGALIGRPRGVFLDEPTAGLDPHVRRDTWTLIASLRDAGVTVLLTTHAMEEAAALADQVWIVDRGRVAVAGTVGELTADASLEDVFLRHTTRGGA